MSGKMPKYKITIEMDADTEDVAREVYEILGNKIDDMFAEEPEEEPRNVIETFRISFDEIYGYESEW